MVRRARRFFPKEGVSVKLPADIKPESVVAIIDTREQLPFDLSPLQTVADTLTTGDYSVAGLTDEICVERKSLEDLVACCGNDRDRFERELRRMLGYSSRLVIVEANWSDLEAGAWRSKIKPPSVIGSVLGWIGWGVPFLLAGDHDRGGRYAARFLFIEARRSWRKLRQLAAQT